MAKKTYSVEWNDVWSILIEVDHSEQTERILHTVNDFWVGNEERLDEADGDITKAVLKLIAFECFRFIVAEDYGLDHLIRKFDNFEGYPKMDGTLGIRIVQYDFVEFDPYSMNIEIVESKNDK